MRLRDLEARPVIGEPRYLTTSELRGIMPVMEVEEWNGKHAVDRRGDYVIAVDDPEDCTFVSAWTADNKKVGSISTRRTPDTIGRDYLSISLAEVHPKHRGNGLGSAMFKALLAHLAPRWKGISSYLPDQANKRQIPAIWKKLGGRRPENADYVVVDRR